MKVLKKLKKSSIVPTMSMDTVFTIRNPYGLYTPYNETEYPRTIENDGDRYDRFYVRSRFIVYEITNRANFSVGFLCICSDYNFVVQGLPYQAMWKQMETWCDKNENNEVLKIIARKL